MKISILITCFVILLVSYGFAGQSILVDSEGFSCAKNFASEGDVINYAISNAIARAKDKVLEHLKYTASESPVLESYSKGTVNILERIEEQWQDNAETGRCFRVIVKAEVVPDKKSYVSATRGIKIVENQNLPLNVWIKTDKTEYKRGENIKIFLKGNKPFYARIVYKDASDNIVQLLPNPYRINNRFNNSVIYEIPGDEDRFSLEVSPPFGREEIKVYASTEPLGDIDVLPAGGVYEIKLAYSEIGIKTRGVGVKSIPKSSAPQMSFNKASNLQNTSSISDNRYKPKKTSQTAEFFEASIYIQTFP